MLSTCSIATDTRAETITSEDLPENLRPGFTTTTTSQTGGEHRTRDVLPFRSRELGGRPRQPRPQGRRPPSLGLLSPMFDDFRTEEERELGLANQLLEFELVKRIRRRQPAQHRSQPGTTPRPTSEHFLLEAVAQLVWTVTEVDRIERVRLLIDGERRQLPTSEGDSDEDQVLGRADYASFDPATLVPEASTTEESTDEVTDG